MAVVGGAVAVNLTRIHRPRQQNPHSAHAIYGFYSRIGNFDAWYGMRCGVFPMEIVSFTPTVKSA